MNKNNFDSFDIEGVSINISLTNGKKLFIEELEKKIWKNKGQISTVMGTYEEKDETLENTVIRELKEEIGLTVKKENIEKNGFFYMYVKDKKIKISKFILNLKIDNLGKLNTNVPDEISKILVLCKNDFKKINIQKIRPGTIETLTGKNKNFYNIVNIENGKYHKNIIDSILKDKNKIGF